MTTMSLKDWFSRRTLPNSATVLARPDRQREPSTNWELCEARTLLAAQLAVNSVSATELVSGTSNAVFTVTLSEAATQPVTVDYSTADGGAKAGTDYQAVSGTLTFKPGDTSESVIVPILGGQPHKANDTFTLALSDPQGATIAANSATGTGTIFPAPALSINDVSVVEGTSGTTNAIFTVTLDPPNIEETVTVDYATQDGTAKAGVDYEPVHGTLTFLPGQTSQTISVPIIGGTTFKPTEMFTVNLSNPTNAIIERGQGTGTIIDSSTPGVLQLSAPTYTVDPSAGSATITVTRTNGTASGVGISYATSGGTAVPGLDYTPVSGTLEFAAGQTSQTFTIPILSNLILGPDKTVGINLSQPTGGGSLGSQSAAILTITNPNTLVVTNTNDSGRGSFRQAILTANANTPGRAITFNISGNGPFTIAPTSALPTVEVPVTIDATTEPGYQGTPLIELQGSNAGSGVNGLAVTAGNSTVKGLAINRFGASGILLQGGGGNHVVANAIGTNPTGDASEGNAFDGVAINDSSSNVIGGIDASTRNIISGNGITGVQVTGASSSGNLIEGNYIGTDRTGQKDLGNVSGGIYLFGVSGNTIGGDTAGSGNLISGNDGSGIQITGTGSTQNVLQGNLIGTDATGQNALGNEQDGVYVEDANGNTIGGTGIGQGNTISGNHLTGVRIAGASASGNLLEGNRIGTNQTGTRAVGNTYDGVFISGSPGNTVGGVTLGAGNQISGNGGVGVQVYNTSATGNQIQGNLIGTDVTGLRAIGNVHNGVYINDASNNIVGGTVNGSRNIISGNRLVGLQFSSLGATGNVVQGNLIGANILGQPRLGNGYGIYLAGATGNTIGGPGAEANLVAGNRQANILVGSPTSQAGTGLRTQAQSARPTVEQVRLNTVGSIVTSLAIQFSSPMNAARSQDISNYRLRLPDTQGRYGASGSVSIPLKSATYSSRDNTVTLTLAMPLSVGVPFQLQVSGNPRRGLSDASGNLLDGQSAGNGRNYVVVLNTASSFLPSTSSQ